jgi:hypothetical protein
VKRRARKRVGTRLCSAADCRNRRLAFVPFCSCCWYRLPIAFRLAVHRAKTRRHFEDVGSLYRDAAGWLHRHPAAEPPAADRGGEPAVALCGRCQRAAADPVIASCTDARCPFALREAA